MLEISIHRNRLLLLVVFMCSNYDYHCEILLASQKTYTNIIIENIYSELKF